LRSPDLALNPGECDASPDHTAWVRQAALGLPDSFRDVLMLREFGGLTYAQISAMLSVPRSTVILRLAHSRGALHEAFIRNNGHKGTRVAQIPSDHI
jgi:DNA-directed RNA polymerase specialized sigma24 family protein